jgi:D-glycero-alpha-D-manno-heptose 1-phosphate guanylyltransferase
MEAIILAGGLGTRLQARLTDRPKAMAEVAGRPFLQILLDRLIDAGCDRVILSVGHLRHVIMEAFQDHYHDVPIVYAIEETPLGTGGAIRLALNQAREASVLVLNGDTYLHADFQAMLACHHCGGRPMTMAVAEVEDMARYGGVDIEGGHVTSFIEKGQRGRGWINAGGYVLARNFPWPDELAPKFSFETDVLSPLLPAIRPTAFRCPGYFLDIGIPEDLDRAQIELAGKDHGPQA